MGKFGSGIAFCAIGIGIGWWKTWTLDFNEPLNWIWLLLLILGGVLILQGLYEVAFAFGIASLVTGMIWGSVNGFVTDMDTPFSQHGWLLLTIVGLIIIVMKYLGKTLTEKKWMGRKEKKKKKPHHEFNCPQGMEYNEEEDACMIPTDRL